MTNADTRIFEEAASWAGDREAQRERSRRRAWLIVWVLATIAALEAFALIALVPLKTVVPYTILVDRQTGYTTMLDPAKPATLGSDEALKRSMLVQYVVAREGFSFAEVRGDYRKVMSWSDGVARASYARDMAATNPDSPVARYGRNNQVTIYPKSVSDLSDGSAMVRYDQVETGADGRASAPIPYAAVVTYRFQPRAMSVEERFINPLGFEVTRYRRDPEAVTIARPAPAPSTRDMAAPPTGAGQ